MSPQSSLSERRAGPRDRRSAAVVRRRDDYEHTLAILDSAHEAFVSMDEAGAIRGWNAMAERTFGWTREEVLGQDLAEVLIPERLRGGHRAALTRFLETGEAPMVGRRIELVAARRDGSEIPVELTISVTRSAGGHAFHAFLHDISERRRSEQYMHAQLAASRVLAGASDLPQAWEGVLRALGEGLGWDVGQAWVVEGDRLRCDRHWLADGVDGAGFERASFALRFAKGEGLPGIVWRDRRPLWVANVADHPEWVRADAASAAGLHAGLALPVMTGGQVLGVLELFARRAYPADESLLQTLMTIGEQLGEFTLRHRAEERLERAEERLDQLLESTSFLQRLLQNARALIWVKDRDGRYIVANRALEAVCGQDGGSLLGRSDHDLHPPAVADRFRAHDLTVLQSGRSDEFEETIEVDGEEHVFLSVKFPLFDSQAEPIAIGGISTDITARKRAELAAEEARVAAVRADREKSELLSRMSHELRTPLNAILGFGQLLEMDLEGAPRDDVQRILAAGRRLLELVDDVLQITREGASPGQLTPLPTEVGPVLQEAVDAAAARAHERDVSLAAPLVEPGAARALAEPHLLGEIMGALVENAVRFSPSGAEVLVRARPHDRRVRIEVHDAGPGIPATDVERAFLPFERLDVAPDGERGKGLGLTLARRHARAMGGDVGHEPRHGGGSVFYVVLDAAKDGTAAAHSNGADGTRGTLLYIDDSPSNLQIVEQTLERRPGVSLLTAVTGREGIDVAAREHPDLILLDLNLPDMAGEEVLARLLADERIAEVPVLMLSADASEDTAARLLSLGAADYLTKPFDLGRFLDVVDDRLAPGGAS